MKSTQEFARDGVIKIPNALTSQELELLRQAVDQTFGTAAPRSRFSCSAYLWQKNSRFSEICAHSRLPRLASELLTSESIYLWVDELFVKEPGSTTEIHWHNDLPYYPLRGSQMLSFWIALDPVSIQNAGIEFILGSHLWNHWLQPKALVGEQTYSPHSLYVPIPDFESQRKLLPIKTFDLLPGDALAFHGLTVHSSKGNQSSHQRRRGYSIRYCGDDVTYDPREGTSPIMRRPELSAGAPIAGIATPRVYQSQAIARHSPSSRTTDARPPSSDL